MVLPTVLVTVKMAAKVLVKPVARSSALVLPMPVIHVIRMVVLSRAIEVMPKNEALLVGRCLRLPKAGK